MLRLQILLSGSAPTLERGLHAISCFLTTSRCGRQLLTAVEAVNGGSVKSGISDVPFWNKELNRGCRLTGIGGSDNHRPMQPLDQQGSIGSPTTVELNS